MSETRDKRCRTDLVVFVLALIETGVSTPYEMQKMAGLSQGATIPVLQKLLEADLVRQLKTGPSGRTGHKTTAAGRKFLSSSWRTLIDDGPSGDLDADLRVALLAVSWVATANWQWTSCSNLHTESWRQSSRSKSVIRFRTHRSLAGTADCGRLQRKPCSKGSPPRLQPWPKQCPGVRKCTGVERRSRPDNSARALGCLKKLSQGLELLEQPPTV